MRSASSAATSVRVLIVDDSPVAREVLRDVLESDAGIRVVGMAGTGKEAVELTARLKPDVVTMDLMMPGMDGMEATERIMARNPTPILFLSAFIGPDGAYSRSDALAAGALDVVEKPSAMPDPGWQRDAGMLTQKVKTLAQVPVVTHIRLARRLVRRSLGEGGNLGDAGRAPRDSDRARPAFEPPRAGLAVVIGASTGGPKVLDELLSALPASYEAAVIVVQHLADAFLPALIGSLRARCALEVKIAENGDRLRPGRILVAPPAAHLVVMPRGRVRIDDGEPVRGFRPSIDVTMTSVAQNFGARACGVLLSGMGADGAAGLQAIKQAGGRTMVQDERTCVVFGMPRAAIDRGAAQHVLPPAGLIRQLLTLHRVRRVQE
jgi:two-component system chemotaxis response regulator CheB